MFEMHLSDLRDQKHLRRNGLTVMSVLALHAGLIWTLQNGLAAPVPELIVPVSLMVPTSERADAPAPVARPAVAPAPIQAVPKPVPPTPPKLAAKPAAMPAKTEVTPQPSPAALAPAPSPSADATKSASTAAPSATSSASNPASSAATPASTAATGPSIAAPPALQLPSSDADYLRNPKPVYPPLSKRLNEQGTVIHSVVIAADGRPMSAKLVKSSGFDRLDRAAYDAVMQWRYVPGKRQGVPEAMTFNVPIKWVLE